MQLIESISKGEKGREFVEITVDDSKTKHTYIYDKDIWFGIKNLIASTVIPTDYIDDINRFLFDKVFWSTDPHVNYEQFSGIPLSKNLKPILLVGPPGTGKTSLATIVGKYYGLDIFIETFNEGTTKGDITETIAPTEKGFNIVKNSSFIKAVENASNNRKTMLILDEISRTNSEVQAFFIEFLNDTNIKGRNYYVLKLNMSGQTIEVPRENLIIVGTANLEGNVNAIDEALLDRFGMTFYIDNMPAQQELKIVMNKGMSKPLAEILVSFANSIRNMYKAEQDLTKSLSTRQVVNISEHYMYEVYRNMYQLIKDKKMTIEQAYNSINHVELLKNIVMLYADSLILHNYDAKTKESLENQFGEIVKSVLTKSDKDEEQKINTPETRTINRSSGTASTARKFSAK